MDSGIQNPTVTVLDTNIIVSALVYGGLPEKILSEVLESKLVGAVSLPLIAENLRILREKFNFSVEKIEETKEMFEKHFILVHPKETIKIVSDDPDNRVLEAAVEGKCEFIITGDKMLLDLKVYKEIKIITAANFANLAKSE